MYLRREVYYWVRRWFCIINEMIVNICKIFNIIAILLESLLETCSGGSQKQGDVYCILTPNSTNFCRQPFLNFWEPTYVSVIYYFSFQYPLLFYFSRYLTYLSSEWEWLFRNYFCGHVWLVAGGFSCNQIYLHCDSSCYNAARYHFFGCFSIVSCI